MICNSPDPGYHTAWAWVLLLLFLQPWQAAQAMDARDIFEMRERSLHQVRVINRKTGKKSTIGSGFVVLDEHHLATNYHVVADLLQDPGTYELRFRASDGSEGPLEMVDLDVVHDLALLRGKTRLGEPLPLADPPPKGAPVYAMGNPLDLGLTIAAGTSGGVLDQTDGSRILFSGNLNAGMSGGPSFDENGAVVGINVATARNAISFIVPTRYLVQMLERATARNLGAVADFDAVVDRQLGDYQRLYLQRILAGQWPMTSIGKARVPGSISPTIRCWDASPKPAPEELHRRLKVSCKNENDIYLSSRLKAGQLAYEYIWLDGGTLDAVRFHRYYQTMTNSQIASQAGKDDVGRFDCLTGFVDVRGEAMKTTLCRRSYLKYPELSDILFTSALVGRGSEGFLFNLDLVGTDFDSALAIIERLLGEITWET